MLLGALSSKLVLVVIMALKKVRPADRLASGTISADQAYTVDELRNRLRIGDYLWRRMRKHVRLRYVGTRIVILGRDVLAFLDSEYADGPEAIEK